MQTESDTWDESVNHNRIDDTTQAGYGGRKADRIRQPSFKPVRTNCDAGKETGTTDNIRAFDAVLKRSETYAKVAPRLKSIACVRNS
jgi:hypothetical protein